MNVSVILAHPTSGSLNHAIAEAAADEVGRNGHEVSFHDLYRERFDPLLPAGEIDADARLPSEIAAYCEETAQADGFVIVHPNWWGGPPAILKGWVDRVMRPRVAYRFLDGDGGEGVPQGLLKAKTAIILNTANTPPERELSVFEDPLELFWRNCVFDLCGVDDVRRRVFTVVVTSSPEQREAWLLEVRDLVGASFAVGGDG
ncbi:MAG: NAD(P)H-dependent oxidoreductase [Thermoleophilia bacterium]|nr:NAD(P)H-dependent oxidoreductase [Thermoleophilia bacterium]